MSPPPDRLVDAAAGALHVRLFPLHLERLHGPVPPNAVWVDASPYERLPTPLRIEAEPVDLVLSGETTPRQLADIGVDRSRGTEFDGRYWFSWSAYAQTPFGWCSYVTPSFRVVPGAPVEDARLASVPLHRRGGTPVDNFEAMDAWLRHELGEPTRVAGDRKLWLYERSREWDFPWGQVALYHEYRDREAELSVTWPDD